MEISNLISNPYLMLGVLSLVVVSLDIITFLEKVKQKLKRYKDAWEIKIKEEYKDNPLNVAQFDRVYDKLVKRDEEFDKVESNISTNIWTGLIIISLFFIGFILSFTEIDEGFVIGGLSIFGIFFVLSTISLIYWYAKN